MKITRINSQGFDEPRIVPSGFGVRQSSGAFGLQGHKKAVEDCRSPRRFAFNRAEP